jgi:NADPH-dependent glutamate synthase beta subunit-like oxidoreductase
MTADDEEIEQATEEGIHVHPGQTFESINGEDAVCSVTFCDIESFTFDENRRAIIKKVEGSEHTIACDTVIFATGQRTDLAEDSGLERGRGNCIATKPGTLNTSVEGIFACGDAIYGTKSVVQAIASGREAVEVIDKYLGGDGDISAELLDPEPVGQELGKASDDFYQPAVQPEFVPADERKGNFDTFECPFTEDEARCEASRCLQCDLRLTITKPRLWNEY